MKLPILGDSDCCYWAAKRVLLCIAELDVLTMRSRSIDVCKGMVFGLKE